MPTTKKQPINLSPDQADAQTKLTQWYNRVQSSKNFSELFALQGGAGTGKTTIISDWFQKMGIPNEHVFTMAVSANTSENAREKTNAGYAITVASFIKSPKHEVIIKEPRKHVKNPQNIHINNLSEFSAYVVSMLKDDTKWKGYENEKKAFRDAYKKSLDLLNIQTNAKNLHGQRYTNRPQTITSVSINDIPPSLLLEDLNIKSFEHLLPELEMRHETKFITNYGDKRPQALRYMQIGFLDEVGMMTQKDIQTIEVAAARYNIAIVTAGDIDQIPPVGGEVNHLIKRQPGDVDMARLTTTHRQSKSSYLYQYAELLKQGASLREAYNLIYNHAKNNNTTITDVHVRNEQTLQANGSLGSLLNSADCIVTFKNKDVRRLTRNVRLEIYAQEAKTQFDFENVVLNGERIIITTNESQLKNKQGEIDMYLAKSRLVNGTTGVVMRVYTPAEMAKLHNMQGNPQWLKLERELDTYGVVCADIYVEGMLKLQRVWLNTIEFSDPRISQNTLRNQTKYLPAISFYYRFYQNVLSNEKHPMYNPYHPQIVYASYGYVMSAHKAQGREWNNVIYYEDITGYIHPDAMSSMRNIRYSGVTRAKKSLILLHNSKT